MLVLTEHERKRLSRLIFILLISCAVSLVTRCSFVYVVGITFLVFSASDVVFTLIGFYLVKLMFNEVKPKHVRELKHTEKQYQYVLDLGKRTVYSYVYPKPLSEVDVSCWTYLGNYMVGVTRKKCV